MQYCALFPCSNRSASHSLQQLDENYIFSLDEENVRRLCVTILSDLKEAQERLNQNSTNSSVPSGTQPPWFHPAENTKDEEEDGDTSIPPPPDDKDDSDESSTQKTATESDKAARSRSPKKPRNPGKQTGDQGFGHPYSLLSKYDTNSTAIIHAHSSIGHFLSSFTNTSPNGVRTRR